MSREEQVEALLTDAFRSSTRNPEHLAFLAAPVVARLLADERAAAWDEGYDVGYDDCLFNQCGLSTDSDAHEYPHENPYRADEVTR